MSTTTTPLWQALAIPAVLTAVAVSQLTSIADDITGAFFGLAPSHQVSLMALLFALIFAAVSIASTLGSSSSSRSSSSSGSGSGCNPFIACGFRQTKPPVYPLDAIQRAKTNKDKFLAVFPMLKQEILNSLRIENELLDEAATWVDEMIEYSVPGGKLNRGVTVLDVVQTLHQQPLP